jgi:hypothetical protein
MVKRINKFLMCLALAVLIFYLSSMNYRHSEGAGEKKCPSCKSKSKCMAIYNKNKIPAMRKALKEYNKKAQPKLFKCYKLRNFYID